MERIAAPHLANLLEFASSLGFDQESVKKKFLSEAKMDLSLVENSVSEGEMAAVIKELQSATNDPFLGLHYGFFMNVKAMGLVYNISKSATDVEQVLLFLKNFLGSTFPIFELSILKRKTAVLIELKCSLGDKEVARQLADTLLCVMYRELNLILSRACKIELQFPCKEIGEYEKFFGQDVKKGTSHFISFDSSQLNAALSPKSISYMGELLPAFLFMLEQAKNTPNFAAQVRKMMLNMCAPELPELEKVAAPFCMSPRTFQRKLREEGSSFRAIANEVKKDLASYLSKSKSLKTQDIAFLLGYSETSAYLHAVKSWENLRA